MAAPASYSLADLMLAFYAQSLGLPALSPVFNAAGGIPGINDSTDVTASGVISALNANLATGVPTANSTVTLPGPLIGLSNLSIQVQGAFVGTLVVQVSNDNINWTSLAGNAVYFNFSSSGMGTNIGGPGIYAVNAGSSAFVRVTCSAYTSGAPVISVKIADTSTLSILAGALPAGSNAIGQVGIAATTNSAAATQAKILSAATTNATSVKASNAKLYIALLTNNSAAAKYIHFYNKASAPTVGTDSPAFTITLPPNTIAQPFVFDHDIGLAFTLGLAYSITGAAGDLDTTVTAVNDVSGVIGYI